MRYWQSKASIPKVLKKILMNIHSNQKRKLHAQIKLKHLPSSPSLSPYVGLVRLIRREPITVKPIASVDLCPKIIKQKTLLPE
jgi:hypothetical protein